MKTQTVEWISVTDSLPEVSPKNEYVSDRVLFTDGKEVIEGRYTRTYYHIEDSLAWFDTLWTMVPGVTHWMPLPKLPSES
jgi:hypothetical protein